MNILYLGDIMGRPGRNVVRKLLPQIKIKYDVDIVIAQSENVSHGRGMSKKHFCELNEGGIDGFTGGNHTFERPDTIEMVKGKNYPIVAPTNVLGDTFKNYKIIENKSGEKVAIVSMLGYTVPKGYDDDVANPLNTIDEVLDDIRKQDVNAIIVNIHSEFSSEKVMAGHALDGKVTAVIGDHWHTATADSRVLTNGTAHITDVGMCGTLNSSIGVDIDIAIKRWRGEELKNQIANDGPYQINGLLIGVSENKLASYVELIHFETITL